MCMSSPKAPPPVAPMPAQAPPVVPTLAPAAGDSTKAALAASRARGQLRIDKTVNVPGGTGVSLSIPK